MNKAPPFPHDIKWKPRLVALDQFDSMTLLLRLLDGSLTSDIANFP
jgi:hypothetical protein